MVRLSFALFALAGLASTFGEVIDPAHSHNGRAVSHVAHSKMVKVRSQSPAPVSAPPSNSTSNSTSNAVEQSKDGRDWKRDGNFRFTFYEAGLGACGSVNTDADYIVALNSAEFGNGENCYKMINIWYNGKQTQAQIVDECPGCPEGGLDFTPGLFSFFSDLGSGVLYGTWWYA